MRLLSNIAAVLAVPLILTTGGLPDAPQPTPDKPKPAAQVVQKIDPPKPKIVKVKAGDSLIKIAKKHKSTHPRLFYANPKIEHPDLIHPGEKIRIPRPDEKLQKRPMPESTTPKTSTTKPIERTSSTNSYSSVKTSYTSSSSSGVWDKLAQCESGGNWSYNGSSGYDGGLQFLPSTWSAYNQTYAYAWQAPREVQIATAEKLLAGSGWGAWPACATKLGLL